MVAIQYACTTYIIYTIFYVYYRHNIILYLYSDVNNIYIYT